MKYYVSNRHTRAEYPNTPLSDMNFHDMVRSCSIPSIENADSNRSSRGKSINNLSDIDQFEENANRRLTDDSNHYSHTMLVFGIDNYRRLKALYGSSTGIELISYINSILRSYVHEPNLFCQIRSDSFAVFLENYKNIDLAMLAIQLTEEISDYNKEFDIKLSFGICQAISSDTSITSLYSRALYARSKIKTDTKLLLADYNEIVHAY